jgi:hypothetical protein
MVPLGGRRVDNPAQIRVGDEMYPRMVVFDPNKNCHFMLDLKVNTATLHVAFKFNLSAGTKRLVVSPLTIMAFRVRTNIQ